MADCIPLSREMLKEPSTLALLMNPGFCPGPGHCRGARPAGRDRAHAPGLVRPGRRHIFAPGDCCGDDKPAWLTYAESRGGDLVIDINGEAYVFVYRRTF